MSTTDITTLTFNFSRAHTSVAHMLHVLHHTNHTVSNEYVIAPLCASNNDVFDTLHNTYQAQVAPVLIPKTVADTLVHKSQPVSLECIYTVAKDNLLTVTTCFGSSTSDTDNTTNTDEELAFEYHVQSAMNIANGNTYQPD